MTVPGVAWVTISVVFRTGTAHPGTIDPINRSKSDDDQADEDSDNELQDTDLTVHLKWIIVWAAEIIRKVPERYQGPATGDKETIAGDHGPFEEPSVKCHLSIGCK